MRLKLLILIAVSALLAGCASAQIASQTRRVYAGPAIHVIALDPGGGALADAIGVELFNDGITVVDRQKTKVLLGHLGNSQIQVATAASYGALRAAGVDALLQVDAVMSADGTPESASVRLVSTSGGTLVAGLVWQNGWGGMAGSMADRTMRKNLATAASQIAADLMKRMQ